MALQRYAFLQSPHRKGQKSVVSVPYSFRYVAGIISKLINADYMANFADKWYVLFFYVLNFIMVFADFCLYFRNKKLDKIAETKEK